jgi:hypothetical protein
LLNTFNLGCLHASRGGWGEQFYGDQVGEHKDARSNHDANDDAGCIQQSKFARQLLQNQIFRPLAFAIRTYDIVASLR